MRSPAPAPFSAVLTEPRKSRGPLIWISLAVLALALSAIGAYLYLGRPQSQPVPSPAPQAQHQLEIDGHMQKAEQAFSQGNYDLAIEEYRAVQQLNPASVRAKEGIERATKAKAAESVILPGAKSTP